MWQKGRNRAREAAAKRSIEVRDFKLEAQFRSNGSDSFIQWVDNTLGLARTPQVLWPTARGQVALPGLLACAEMIRGGGRSLLLDGDRRRRGGGEWDPGAPRRGVFSSQGPEGREKSLRFALEAMQTSPIGADRATWRGRGVRRSNALEIAEHGDLRERESERSVPPMCLAPHGSRDGYQLKSRISKRIQEPLLRAVSPSLVLHGKSFAFGTFHESARTDLTQETRGDCQRPSRLLLLAALSFLFFE